jgi:hypothetical protein
MRTTIFFLSLCLLTFKVGKSQTNVYHPFPDSAAMWNVHFLNFCFGPTTEEFHSILITGDTIINSQTYHKLNIPAIQVLTNSCSIYTTLGYNGAIREDSANKTVYIMAPSSTTEEVLYDFNLQVGDTVRGYFYNTISGNHEVVQSIDSVLVGGNYRKRWNINPNYQVQFIEGVGSTYGLIETLPGGFVTDLPAISVICFSENNMTLYPNNLGNCNLITSMESPENNPGISKIFPNPFSDETTIYADHILSNATLTIYNTQGQVVKQIENITGRTITLNRDNLSSGFYFIHLIESNKVIATDKIVIAD